MRTSDDDVIETPWLLLNHETSPASQLLVTSSKLVLTHQIAACVLPSSADLYNAPALALAVSILPENYFIDVRLSLLGFLGFTISFITAPNL
jgi:hypothetical protein